MTGATNELARRVPYLKLTITFAGVVVLCVVAGIRMLSSTTVTPDPFGTIEQVYASLPERIRMPRREDGAIPHPISHRRMATMDRFTGQPSELEPFLVYLENRPIPAEIPEDEAYLHEDRAELASALRTIARAWPQVEFPGMLGRVLELAVRYADHPDGMIRSQAGLVLLAIEASPFPEGTHAESARSMLADDGPFGIEFRLIWARVIEHARDVAAGLAPSAPEIRRRESGG